MGSFRVGSVFGIEVRIDYSWFIIFFLILWTFTFAVFPANFPGLSAGTYIAMGVGSTVLFFLSLLAHELSHSLVARRRGIPVEGITLFIFGGVARTRMEAETPGDEFLVAVVGPLASIVIGLALFALAWIGANARWHPGIIGSAQYLGFLNIVLAVFNLLPGFPLDGGRLLRAAAWKLTGDPTRATRIASRGGQVLAWLLIGLGVLQMIQGAFIGGLWLVFIGWFLRNAAVASYSQHLVQQRLEHVSAGEAMTPDPETVPPAISLERLVNEHFLRRRYQAYPVAENGRPLGLITLEQVRAVPREEWPRRTVGETMMTAEDGLTVGVEERIPEVLEKMQRTGAGRVLVTREGRLEGIITASDLVGWMRRVQELEG